MKYLFTSLFILFIVQLPISGQRIYTATGGEIIFQSALVEQQQNDINTNLRFSAAFHLGEYLHADLGNNFGFFSGIGLRNVGFITDENDVKIKYRSYNLGIPIAFKIGSFKKNIFVFGGAEYEWMFHFKQKTFVEGEKFKYTSWFSKRTPSFIPSAFAGVQFPGGIQLKFRYYLDNFLNNRYDGGNEYNNYTVFSKTQVWYISLSFMVKNKKEDNSESTPVEMAESL